MNVMLKNLTKRYGNVVAVDDITFEVKDKEFLVLLGPSGCGKTTTIRCIAGLENPEEGEIYIGDRVVNDLNPKERNVAMVFQTYALYPHMTVFDNIAFPLKMQKTPENDIKKRVKQTTEILQIYHLLDRKPAQLSGGEAQRVALGRAIIRDPSVFLMDEPLSNLDAKLRVHLRVELKKLQKKLGVTTIYVTHDQIEAMSLADKIAIINSGVLQQLGDTDKIFNHPTNLFVAGFVGTPPINCIDCTLSEKNGSGFLDCGNFTHPISSDLRRMIKEKATGSELILGIRPEDIYLGNRMTPEKFAKAQIYMTEPLGSEVIVDLKMGDDLIKARAAPNFAMDIGEKVWIGFSWNNIHLFDKKTEKLII